MRSAEQLTAIIQRAVDTLTGCGYQVCGAARTAGPSAGKAPCCMGEQCGSWTVTGSIKRDWPYGRWPEAADPLKCSYLTAHTIELIVARCNTTGVDAGELGDDVLGGEVVDVLDCLHTVWGCDAKAALGWAQLQWVATEPVSHGTCVGWKATVNGAWTLGPTAA